MKLGKNWFYRPRIDAELKQYETLAFERYLNNCLNTKVYFEPYNELQIQLNDVTDFLTEHQQSHYNWSRNFTGIDLQNSTFHYSIHRDSSVEEVELIAKFMLSKVKPFQKKFEDLKHEVENALTIQPVGIYPSYTSEGWLLVEQKRTFDVYYYKKATVIEVPATTHFFKNFSGHHLDPVQVKLSLIKECKDLPNPATWLVQLKYDFPIQETVLPIVTEKLSFV